jgi:hypothetical protein
MHDLPRTTNHKKIHGVVTLFIFTGDWIRWEKIDKKEKI